MIVAGRELDDGTLTWDDLYAFIFASPPNTAVFHAFEKGWTTSDYLLAHLIDGVRITNWQRTEGATKRPPRNIPEPFPRPGTATKDTAEVGDVVSVGNASATVTTVSEFLRLRAEREQRWRDKHNKQGGESG